MKLCKTLWTTWVKRREMEMKIKEKGDAMLGQVEIYGDVNLR